MLVSKQRINKIKWKKHSFVNLSWFPNKRIKLIQVKRISWCTSKKKTWKWNIKTPRINQNGYKLLQQKNKLIGRRVFPIKECIIKLIAVG